MLGAAAHRLDGPPHVASVRQQLPPRRDEAFRIDASGLVDGFQRPVRRVVEHERPDHVAIASDDGMRAAEGKHAIDSGERRGRQHQRAGVGAHHDEALHPGELRGYRIHEHRGGIGSLSAGHVKAHALERGVALDSLRSGDGLALGPNLFARVLHPRRGSRAVAGEANGNERSIALEIEALRFRLLTAGDLGAAAESRLVDLGLTPGTMLKVAHHGSRGSTPEALLEALAAPDGASAPNARLGPVGDAFEPAEFLAPGSGRVHPAHRRRHGRAGYSAGLIRRVAALARSLSMASR